MPTHARRRPQDAGQPARLPWQRVWRWAALMLLLLLPSGTARAQEGGVARLTIGVGLLHASGGGTLWQVAGQPLRTSVGTDSLALARELNSGFGVQFSGAYFPSRYFGFTGEVVVTGLGTGDRCRVMRTSGDRFTEDVCGSLNNTEYSTTTAALAAGVILRPGFHGAIQPYLRLMGGLAVAQQSFIMTSGFARSTFGLSSVSVYQDEGGTVTSPYLGAGVGLAAPVGPGWQLRWELRDNYLRLPAVAAATTRQGLQPRTTVRGHHYYSFSVGVDVVLERKRGRRY